MMHLPSIRIGLPLAAAAALIAAAQLGTAAAQDGPGATGQRPAAAKPTTLMSAVFPSTDLERSVEFYTRGLGMTAARPANPREVVLTFPGGGAGIMLLKPAAGSSAPKRGPGRVIVEVPDLQALAARLRSAGYALAGEIKRNEQYRISIAELEDPDGNSLELIQRGG